MSKSISYNHLSDQTSPYLQMHVSNPVDWYPWGSVGLDKAKQEDKLLVISIGYAACHWCHVMEHESFSDNQVAECMNGNYVSIKIDREERPDIDKVYMDAAILLNGNGGWPLNIIALPDGKPIFAGTYFQKSHWIDILDKLNHLYKTEKNRLTNHAEALTKNIQIAGKVASSHREIQLNKDLLNEIYVQWSKSFDTVHGGISKAPKFPMPVALNYLLEFQKINNNPQALKFLQTTLDGMGNGGIYDHLGGGFARYSVDKYWHVPHFEKMLYDNAQLISLYANAGLATKNERYIRIAEETASFVMNELSSPDGLFYSSYDADSEGEEGAYYVWKYSEIKSLPKHVSELVIEYYMISKLGNWEKNKNILHINESVEKICKRFNITEEEFNVQLSKAKTLLLEIRNKREKPLRDDKIITEWNALMISALCDLFKVTNKVEYLDKALDSAKNLLYNLLGNNGVVYRNFCMNKPTIPGFLPDYAFLIKALLDLYQHTFDTKWAKKADELYNTVKSNFYDMETGLFYYTSKQSELLISRNTEIHDNVIPSSNSVMANNILILSKIFENEEYYQTVYKMLTTVLPDMTNGGAYMSNWMSLYLKMNEGMHEISIVGPQSKAYKIEFNKHFMPNAVFVGESNNSNDIQSLGYKGKPDPTMIYICKNKVCSEPFANVEMALTKIQY